MRSKFTLNKTECACLAGKFSLNFSKCTHSEEQYHTENIFGTQFAMLCQRIDIIMGKKCSSGFSFFFFICRRKKGDVEEKEK